MSADIRILIVGTGGMAMQHALAYSDVDGATVVAGVDTDPARLKTFCDTHNIQMRFTSLNDAIAWGEFDAVSNVTPDAIHYETTLPLVAAGKHVLCEKPLAVNHSDAREMSDLAKAAGIVNAVNLSYRDVPALQQAARLVAEGAIGDVKHFEASYLQSWLTQNAWGNWREEPTWLWRLSTAHGSNGVLGDVGIHIIDFATYIAGSLPIEVSSRLQTFNKAPNDTIGEYALDANDSFVMHVKLANDALGTITATRFASGHINDLRLRIYGDKGGLEVLFENHISRLNICSGANLETASWVQVPCPDVDNTYQKFIDAIRFGTDVYADFARGAELQQVIDGMLV